MELITVLQSHLREFGFQYVNIVLMVWFLAKAEIDIKIVYRGHGK
jgi:hypothetical protein